MLRGRGRWHCSYKAFETKLPKALHVRLRHLAFKFSKRWITLLVAKQNLMHTPRTANKKWYCTGCTCLPCLEVSHRCCGQQGTVQNQRGDRTIYINGNTGREDECNFIGSGGKVLKWLCSTRWLQFTGNSTVCLAVPHSSTCIRNFSAPKLGLLSVWSVVWASAWTVLPPAV